MIEKRAARKARHLRTRKKLTVTAEAPRISVFRSNKHIYAQIIDDSRGITLVSESDLVLKNEKGEKADNIKLALTVGENLATKATKKKIKKVVFDRGGYKYHGRIKAFAEGARKGGLIF